MIVRILQTLALWAGAAIWMYSIHWLYTSAIVLTPFGYKLAVWGGVVAWVFLAAHTWSILWRRS